MEASTNAAKDAVGGTEPVTDLRQLSTEFGGTRGLSKELGVSQRTVQRWLAPAGRQRRQPNPRDAGLRSRINTAETKAGERQRIARIRQRGMTVTFHGVKFRVSDTDDTVERRKGEGLAFTFTPEELDPYLRLAEEQRWTAAGAALEDALTNKYLPGTVAEVRAVRRVTTWIP